MQLYRDINHLIIESTRKYLINKRNNIIINYNVLALTIIKNQN